MKATQAGRPCCDSQPPLHRLELSAHALCLALGELVGTKGTRHLSSRGLAHTALSKLADGDRSGVLSPLPGGLGLLRQGWGPDTQDLSRVLEGVTILATDSYGCGGCRCARGHTPGSQMHVSRVSQQAWEELWRGAGGRLI